MISETDSAWAAGFIDGEGCIQMPHRKRKGHESFSLMVTAVNTDIRPLERLQCTFGGTIMGLHKGKNPKWRRSWVWQVSHSKAEAFLLTILPWLTCKRDQAEIAILSRKYVGKVGLPLAPDNREALRGFREQLKQLRAAPVVPGPAMASYLPALSEGN